MRLHGFLTVSAVLISFIPTSSALPATIIAKTNLLTSPQAYLQYGGQANPDTFNSSPPETTAEHAGSESSEEACDCVQGHSSILDEPSTTTPVSSTLPAYSYLTSSFVTSVAVIPASTSSDSTSRVLSTPQPQQGNPSLVPVPTYIGPTAIAPSLSAVPSTIMSAAALPTNAMQADGGEEWYQVTYWECVTWPSDYVHCGWHTPLRKGKNPDPNGETFVHGAGSNVRARVWLAGSVWAVVLALLQ